MNLNFKENTNKLEKAVEKFAWFGWYMEMDMDEDCNLYLNGD